MSFCNTQCGVGLASAAGHNQAATIMVAQALNTGLNSFHLLRMRRSLLPCAATDGIIAVAYVVRQPFDILCLQDLFGILANRARGN